MKNTISSFIKEFIKVVIIVAIAVPTIALFAAWTGPTGAPPTNNADAPVNVGNNSQEKKGDLSIHRAEGGFDVGLFTTDILSVLGGAIFNTRQSDDKKVVIETDGNVGIGTVSPRAKLDVTGNIKITDGTQGDGKVLTSDADGRASWMTPTGGAQEGKAWGGTKYINDGTEINCSLSASFFIGGMINFYAKAENSNIFLRILRNNANRGGWNFDTGWVNRLEINGVTYQNGYQDDRISSRMWSGYLHGKTVDLNNSLLGNCEADWP